VRLGQLEQIVSGKLEHADPDKEVHGIQTLKFATSDEVAFLANSRYKSEFDHSRAAVVLLGKNDFPGTERPVVRVKDPYLAFALLQRHFKPLPTASGYRHPSANIDPGAHVADSVDVGALAVIEADAEVGEGSIIGPGCIVGKGARIGANCILHPGSILSAGCVLGDRSILQAGAVVGSDGFGYAWNGKEHLKIPQVGRVIIGDDVEIGANTCIDRGTIGDTVIENGVKLDNLIQIGHNVRIGAFSIMASQVGISGSTEIGHGCQFGGQVGVAGHLRIGQNVKIAAKSGVMGDLETGGIYAGIPVMPHRLWLKATALFQRLPQLWRSMPKPGKGGTKQDDEIEH